MPGLLPRRGWRAGCLPILFAGGLACPAWGQSPDPRPPPDLRQLVPPEAPVPGLIRPPDHIDPGMTRPAPSPHPGSMRVIPPPPGSLPLPPPMFPLPGRPPGPALPR